MNRILDVASVLEIAGLAIGFTAQLIVQFGPRDSRNSRYLSFKASLVSDWLINALAVCIFMMMGVLVAQVVS